MILLRWHLFFALFGIISIYASFEFNNAKCVVRDPKYLRFEYCYLRSTNRTFKYFSLKTHFYQLPITNGLMHYQIMKRDSKHIFGRFNTTIDVCRYLRERGNVLANIIASAFMDYTNINHTCPYYHDVFLEKLPTQHVNNIVKNVLPDGRYFLNLSWSTDNIARADIVVYFTKS